MVRLVPGPEEGGTLPLRTSESPPAVDILVPVHNEWHVLRPCLDSLEAFTSYPNAQIAILDDGSDAFVQQRMRAFVAEPGPLPKRMLRNEAATGFVKNSNRGFAEARGEWVVLLNSDTVVTPGWLEGLVDAGLSDPRIACVMPMSNQCSFHSLAIPMGWNVFQYAADVRRRAERTCFDAVTAGGFCLLIRREALRDVGGYDEAFGMGYGEESDWCMRARTRGWKIVGVEDTFVYHRGKVTFRDYKEKNFKETNYQLFMQRWSELYSKAMAEYHARDALRPLREAYVRMDSPTAPPVLSAFIDRVRAGGAAYATVEAGRYIRDQGGVRRVPAIIRQRGLTRRHHHKHPMPRGFQSRRRPRVTYVLEKFSLSGGVLSVVQLVNRLTLLGWDAKIATHHDHDQEHLGAFMLYHQPYVFPSAEAMIEGFPESDIVVATLWSTAFKVRRILQERLPRAIPWYFIQDDETRFFHELDREGRAKVLETYDLIPGKIAKSDWLQGLLRERGHETHKVRLGLDLDVFYPESSPAERPLRVLGMARPRTPRRGFPQLVAAMREIKRRRPQVEVAFFGCDDLAEHGLDFEYTDLGIVPNDRLRRVYGASSILIDLSEFQGFGRMGLEAMACGCAAVLTRFGGISEYARHEQNCLSVDPANFEGTLAAIERLVDDAALRNRLVEEGLRTAQEFDCDLEARSTSRLFAESLGIEEDVREGAKPLGPRERKRAIARAR